MSNTYYVVSDTEAYGPYSEIGDDIRRIYANTKKEMRILRTDDRGMIVHDRSDRAQLPPMVAVHYMSCYGHMYKRMSSEIDWHLVSYYVPEKSNYPVVDQDNEKQEALVDGEWVLAQVIKKHGNLYAVIVEYEDEGIPELCWATDTRKYNERRDRVVQEVLDAIEVERITIADAEKLITDIYNSIEDGVIKSLEIKS